MQPFQTQIQCQNGLWAKLDVEHPVPVLIMNEMEPKPIQISVAEQKEVIVTNLPDLGMVKLLADEIKGLKEPLQNIAHNLFHSVSLMVDIANEGQVTVNRIYAEYTQKLDQIGVIARWFFIVQGATCVLALAALIVAIVR